MTKAKQLGTRCIARLLAVSVRLKIMGIAAACVLLLGLGLLLYARAALLNEPGVPADIVGRFTLHFLLATAAVALLGMGIAYLLMTIIAGPIMELAAAASAVAEGDLTRRARPRANDEVGRLARAFNSMVEQLEGSIASLRRANDQLREKNAALSRLGEELRRRDETRMHLLRRLIDSQEEERRRVARELHDQTGQHLAALSLGVQAFQQLCPHHPDCPVHPAAGHQVRQLEQLADRLMREVHHLAWELRPAALDDWGLDTALQRHTEKWSEQSGVPVDLHCRGFEGAERLPLQLEVVLYRVVQEALTNVLKHAAARRVSVLLERRAEQVAAIVEDDGHGFDAEAVLANAEVGRRLGILGMQERTALAGGNFSLESSPGAGTTVFVRIPLASRSAAAARLPGSPG